MEHRLVAHLVLGQRHVDIGVVLELGQILPAAKRTTNELQPEVEIDA